jgi:hypothetical protein
MKAPVEVEKKAPVLEAPAGKAPVVVEPATAEKDKKPAAIAVASEKDAKPAPVAAKSEPDRNAPVVEVAQGKAAVAEHKPATAPDAAPVDEHKAAAGAAGAARAIPLAPVAPAVHEHGPAPAAMPGWVKGALAAAAGVILILGGLVFHFATRPPAPGPAVAVAPTPSPPTAPPAKVDPPAPIGIPDSPPTIAAAPSDDPSTPGSPTRRGAGHWRRGTRGGGGAPATPGAAGPSAADEALIRAMQGGSDTAAPSALPRVATAERKPTLSNAAAEAAIGNVVKNNRRSLQPCFERFLKQQPDLKNARVDVDVDVGTSGRVTKVTLREAAYANSDIGSCFTKTIRQWPFPSTGETYSVPIPLILQAQ